MNTNLARLGALVCLLSAHCGGIGDETDDINTVGANPVNLAAGSMVLYEVQVRSANACRPDVGSSEQRAACQAKISPTVEYRAQGMSCGILGDLEKIRLGTLDDMLEDTADYRKGITLRYIRERVGATTVWLMPLFPNNDQWNLPDGCDNLGSPYAVRDYMHASGMLSRACIQAGRDEHSDEPCWGNAELDRLIQQAHQRGAGVFLDVALNHFGHNYMLYDYADYKSVRDRAYAGQDLDKLWDFGATYEEFLVRPKLMDDVDRLESLAASNDFHRHTLEALRAKCPDLEGDQLVRAYNAWREAFDHEREAFSCEHAKNFLEFQAPGFYLGQNASDPSKRLGDNFTNEWRDVKFLFHHEENDNHYWDFVRVREYLFRIMNYWVSRGVDGFRLDHTTDYHSGMGSNEWKYIINKVNFYAAKRGQQQPVYLAEEFGDQMEMNKVADIMTEGYVGDMNGRNGATKDANHVERVLNNMDRFSGRVFTMTALETHDEHRLLDGTGFNVWTGAGFWGIGATTRSTPMMLMGQEFGEPYGLGFRRSDFLRGRFVGTSNYNQDGDKLIGLYNRFITERLRPENRALLWPHHRYLRTRDSNSVDGRIFAQVKWTDDANVMFVFHNLWEQSVSQSYFIDPDLANQLHIEDGRRYKLVDVISGHQQGDCHSGADLKWDFFVSMDAGTRAQWLRLELC
ncbi:MAG TPA: alpha-amylase family glycosyl hydrolase [Polyangiaceae bacterium]|nr:alpha-amylase family glycosyl hydrolase [Polyangiaceae bacterium]